MHSKSRRPARPPQPRRARRAHTQIGMHAVSWWAAAVWLGKGWPTLQIRRSTCLSLSYLDRILLAEVLGNLDLVCGGEELVYE